MPKVTPLDIGAVSFDTGPPGQPTLPLTITPKGECSAEFLASWAHENESWLKQKTTEHGAIRFRGFAVTSAVEFEKAILNLDVEMSNKYRGTSPRVLEPGTTYIFSASEVPPFLPIPQHIEMSFLPSPPHWIFFCCLNAPTSKGGETSLCDFRRVYDDLNPEFKQRLYEKKVRYVRNYRQKSQTMDIDLSMLKGWEDLFETTDKAAVEDDARQDELTVDWKENDDLRLTNVTEPYQVHPETGDKVWFNHMQLFHQKLLARELMHSARRTGNLLRWLFAWLLLLLSHIILFVRGSENLGMHTMYGDGTEVSRQDCDHLQETVWKHTKYDRWQLGDILMIDNLAISHGRQPFTGKRKIVVGWANPLPKENKPIDDFS
eukprot:scpid42881/ scgid16311/ Clavaminate synthase-like protein At3g21360